MFYLSQMPEIFRNLKSNFAQDSCKKLDIVCSRSYYCQMCFIKSFKFENYVLSRKIE